MEEWKEYKLKEVGQITTGKTPLTSNSKYFDGSIHFITPADINNPYKYISETSRSLSQEGLESIKNNSIAAGSICVSCIGNIGYVGMSTMDCSTNQQINSITVNDKFDNDYVYYAIKNLWKLFKSYEGQSTTLSILNKSMFSEIKIKAPSLFTQKRISEILSSLDDKIEINRRINDNLEQQAQALFKSWFVDFEPFKDGEFEESEIGMIPKGWKVTTFINNIDIMPGGTPSTNIDEYWKNGDIPFFSPKDVRGVYCFETEKYITKLGLNHCNSHLYPKDTLFITARGTVGKITLAGVPMAMNQSNYALVAKEGIGKYYLYLLAHSLVNVLLKKANGAVFSAITTKDFIEPTITPPMSVLQNFERIISSLFEKIHAIGIESHNLSSLRDALLPRLMSGELKPSNITL